MFLSNVMFCVCACFMFFCSCFLLATVLKMGYSSQSCLGAVCGFFFFMGVGRAVLCGLITVAGVAPEVYVRNGYGSPNPQVSVKNCHIFAMFM